MNSTGSKSENMVESTRERQASQTEEITPQSSSTVETSNSSSNDIASKRTGTSDGGATKQVEIKALGNDPGIEIVPTVSESEEGSAVPSSPLSAERKSKIFFLVVSLLFAACIIVAVSIIFKTRSSGNDGDALQGQQLLQTSPPTIPLSPAPTSSPTENPTSRPSTNPTANPTSEPSDIPSDVPSVVPSGKPSLSPSEEPSMGPTASPSAAPSSGPSTSPSSAPTSSPSDSPSDTPTQEPTAKPSGSPTKSQAPSASPTSSPSDAPSQSQQPTQFPSNLPTSFPTITSQPTLNAATYVPGNLTHMEVGLLLSQGLHAKLIGKSGESVEYMDGTFSEAKFHGLPDYGTTFLDERPENPGGWVYTSNSEMKETYQGGVGAITFDKDGNVLDYRMVLENTTMNCGGGRTPWNTFVSCEEVEDEGEIYQVDPFGVRPGQKMTLGSELGRWESFAYDVRNKTVPHFFATEDHNKGTVRRFTPFNPDWENPWDMLHTEGITDYLIVDPNDARTGGTFEWTNDLEAAKFNAREFYPQSEGIDVFGNEMYVVCKRIKQLFTFDLDAMTYRNQSTVTGLFDGGPDQMQRILGHTGDLLYFTEEGGRDAGIHARDDQGRFYTVLESPVYEDETTGLAFSPDGKYLFVAYQVNGLLFQIWREDGLPFQARTLNVKYHQTAMG